MVVVTAGIATIVPSKSSFRSGRQWRSYVYIGSLRFVNFLSVFLLDSCAIGNVKVKKNTYPFSYTDASLEGMGLWKDYEFPLWAIAVPNTSIIITQTIIKQRIWYEANEVQFILIAFEIIFLNSLNKIILRIRFALRLHFHIYDIALYDMKILLSLSSRLRFLYFCQEIYKY